MTMGPDRNKRRFVCFACGVVFADYTDYKAHIEGSHEQGRDYVKCPRCDAPVRDLKLHWRVKHPKFPPPVGVQDRAIILRDFKSNGEKRGTRKPTFKSGDHRSTKTGKTLHYRSGYEEATYKLLDQLDGVVSYDAEPLEIPYLFEGRPHKYVPDLAVLFADGRKEIWEIKPSKQTKLPVNSCKWAAAGAFCTGRGWGFLVLTESGINKLRWEVVRQKRTRDQP